MQQSFSSFYLVLTSFTKFDLVFNTVECFRNGSFFLISILDC